MKYSATRCVCLQVFVCLSVRLLQKAERRDDISAWQSLPADVAAAVTGTVAAAGIAVDVAVAAVAAVAAASTPH